MSNAQRPSEMPWILDIQRWTFDIRFSPMTSTAATLDSASPRAAIPWINYAVLFAATSAVVGVIWDISWHRTIGRDAFWTPAHMAIYLSGIVAGTTCGWIVLKTTFAGTPNQRAA